MSTTHNHARCLGIIGTATYQNHRGPAVLKNNALEFIQLATLVMSIYLAVPFAMVSCMYAAFASIAPAKENPGWGPAVGLGAIAIASLVTYVATRVRIRLVMDRHISMRLADLFRAIERTVDNMHAVERIMNIRQLRRIHRTAVVLGAELDVRFQLRKELDGSQAAADMDLALSNEREINMVEDAVHQLLIQLMAIEHIEDSSISELFNEKERIELASVRADRMSKKRRKVAI